jgi:hypothetical protein
MHAHGTAFAAATLTAELAAIVSTDVPAGATIKIEAAAGAGKSTALRLYVEARAPRSALLLTFTSAEAKSKEAEYKHRGLDFLLASTLHALAFAATHDLHGGHIGSSFLLSATIVATLTSTSASAWPSARLNALHRSLDVFVTSDAPAMDASHLQRITDDHGVLEAAKAVWLTACDPSASSVLLTHDAYLKVCVMEPARRAAMFSGIETVLLDEAHDCTKAQLDLVAALPRAWALVMVYDSEQRIYGWRHAAMDVYLRAIPAIAVRPLRASWRYGPAVARLASNLLSRHLHHRVQINGNPLLMTTICEVPGAPFVRVCGIGCRLVVVARQWLSLFDVAMAGLASRAVVRIDLGGTGASTMYNTFGGREQLLDVCALYLGRMEHEMLDPSTGAGRFAERGFATYQMAARANGDQKALRACAVVEKFGAALPQLLRRLEVAMSCQSPHCLTLLTVHAAKGGEWEYVFVHNDLKRVADLDLEDEFIQLRMLYVAITRASRTLFLPTVIVSSWFMDIRA